MDLESLSQTWRPILTAYERLQSLDIPPDLALQEMAEAHRDIRNKCSPTNDKLWRILLGQAAHLHILQKVSKNSEGRPLAEVDPSLAWEIREGILGAVCIVDLVPRSYEDLGIFFWALQGLFEGKTHPLWSAPDTSMHGVMKNWGSAYERSCILKNNKSRIVTVTLAGEDSSQKTRTIKFWENASSENTTTARDGWFNSLGAQWKCPGVFRVYDYGFRNNSPDNPFIVTETAQNTLWDNPSYLRNFIDDPALLRSRLINLLEPLAAYHRFYIHADLKGSNIGLRADGRGTLLDHGFCMSVENAGLIPSYKHERFTPGYLPPEASPPAAETIPLGKPRSFVKSDWRWSRRGDVYSFSKALLVCITGHEHADAEAKALRAFAYGKTPEGDSLNEAMRAMPKELLKWLAQGLAPDPNERFQDASAMLDALREITL